MESSALSPCKLGNILKDECHKMTFSRKQGFLKFSAFSDEDRELIHLRSGISMENGDTVCLHHSKLFLSLYENRQLCCADPKRIHKKKVVNKSSLRTLNIEYAKILGLVPGQKLCTNCWKTLRKESGLDDGPTTTATTLKDSKALQQPTTKLNEKEKEDKLNVPITATATATTATTTLNVSPIKDVSPENGNKTDIKKKEPSKEYSGSCHCGAVQFKCVAPEKLLVLDCNCSICHIKQNSHFIINKADFTLLKGDLTVYRFNTMKAEHMFCKTCGIQSFFIPRSNPDSYGINPRCLKSLDPSSITVEKFDGLNWEESFAKKAPKSTLFEK